MKSSLEEYAQFAVDHAADTGPGTDYVIKLDRTPLVDTIVVKINGRLIKPDQVNGWTYDASTISLTSHGSSIPKKGDFVSVSYDYQE